MSISPDTAAAIFASEYQFRPGDDMVTLRTHELEAAFARAIRADRQQFAPYIQIVRQAIVNTEKNPTLGYLPLMIVAAKLADAITDGMVEK